MIEDGIVFGDVFYYKGNEYVFFVDAAEEGKTYAGKILDIDNTAKLQSMSKAVEKKSSHFFDAPMFSFVVLSTDEFKRRAVLCRVHDQVTISRPHCSLSVEDVRKIKQEIIDKPGLDTLKALLRDVS